MNESALLLAAFSVISSLFITFLLVGLGWYIVWKLFLSRFKLVRELLGGVSDSTVTDTRDSRSKVRRPRRE